MHTKNADEGDDDGSVRLDKWLWAARFYKTRALAAEAVDLGRVRVNGVKVKPAKAMRVDDLVSMRIGLTDREVRVRVPAATRAAAPIAQTFYAETEASVTTREAAEARRRLQREPATTRTSRPTKRDRRELEAFDDLRAAREHEDARIVAWVGGLDEAALDGVIRYRRVSTPEPVEQRLAPALAHWFNHQTHHRGQAHALVTAAGAPGPELDLLFYQRSLAA